MYYGCQCFGNKIERMEIYHLTLVKWYITKIQGTELPCQHPTSSVDYYVLEQERAMKAYGYMEHAASMCLS